MIFGLCHVNGLPALAPRLVQAPMLLAKGSALAAIILILFAGHALCDYPLQGDYLAMNKNRHRNKDEGWWRDMFAHCVIHAVMVLFVTGCLWMAIAELVIHFATDCAKCEGWISSNTDQAIHYGCKLLWALLIFA